MRDVQALDFRTLKAIKQCVMADMGIAVLLAVAARLWASQHRMVALPWSVPNCQLVSQLVRHRER